MLTNRHINIYFIGSCTTKSIYPPFKAALLLDSQQWLSVSERVFFINITTTNSMANCIETIWIFATFSVRLWNILVLSLVFRIILFGRIWHWKQCTTAPYRLIKKQLIVIWKIWHTQWKHSTMMRWNLCLSGDHQFLFSSQRLLILASYKLHLLVYSIIESSMELFLSFIFCLISTNERIFN